MHDIRRGGEAIEEIAGYFPERLDGPECLGAQQRLQLGESLFDRVSPVLSHRLSTFET